jgi:hypothetical protein
MRGSHSNRKATDDEMTHATQVIQQAYPEYDVVWGYLISASDAYYLYRLAIPYSAPQRTMNPASATCRRT